MSRTSGTGGATPPERQGLFRVFSGTLTAPRRPALRGGTGQAGCPVAPAVHSCAPSVLSGPGPRTAAARPPGTRPVPGPSRPRPRHPRPGGPPRTPPPASCPAGLLRGTAQARCEARSTPCRSFCCPLQRRPARPRYGSVGAAPRAPGRPRRPPVVAFMQRHRLKRVFAGGCCGQATGGYGRGGTVIVWINGRVDKEPARRPTCFYSLRNLALLSFS